MSDRVMRTKLTILITTGFAASLLLTSCASVNEEYVQKWKLEADRKVFRVAHRQLPLEPTYNRLRWVHLPEVMPAAERPREKPPKIMPIIELVLEDDTLEDASLILAATTRYRSYCSSLIADQKITLSALGTVDELAVVIAESAGINVTVDHTNREVRFLARAGESNPSLTRQEASGAPDFYHEEE